MSGIRVVCSVVLALSLMLSGGACRKNKDGAGGKSAADSLPDDSAARSNRLQATVDDLNATVSRLPSGDDRSDQRNIGRGLSQVSTALRLMSEEESNGAFVQQIATIDRTSDMLLHASSDRDPEPVINSGFWSALNAIQHMVRRFDDSQTVEQVAKLDAQVRELDTVRGPLHRLVASEVLGSTSQVIARMADLYVQAEQRRLPAAEPTTAPAE